MTRNARGELQKALQMRFSDAPLLPAGMPVTETHAGMASRGSCRAFQEKEVPDSWLDPLCAIALSAPTKSDLQQCDIVALTSISQRQALADLVAGQTWVATAPLLLVFCGNNRRQRMLHEWRGVPFANDHLDAFFNAAADAAVVLGAFVTAAEAMGLGCCPISAVRNKAAEVSKLLALPDHVFPFAGLALGFPAQAAEISQRLPLHVTCHTDRYDETRFKDAAHAYDRERAEQQPYNNQRFVEVFGESDEYSWSEDKVRQYSQPERASFGTFIRNKKFRLD